mgnify:CR=1 FL=1
MRDCARASAFDKAQADAISNRAGLTGITLSLSKGRRGGARMPAFPLRVAADHGHELALDPYTVGAEDAGFVGGVGGFEGDGVAALAQALQRGFFVIDQGHDDVAAVGVFAAADNDDVAIEDAGADHGIAFDLKGKVIVALQIRRRGDTANFILKRFDRSASGDAMTEIFPPEQQARAAALQIVAIGVLMAVILLLRPRGLLGEQVTVSRHI